MSVVLYRVDERLIHGQVVVGWGTALHPDRIVVVDDELARSRWEQELYSLGLPAELIPSFADVANARSQLRAWQQDAARVIVLTRDVATMRRLAQHGLMRGEEVNIGGIHHATGRAAVLPYVFLSPQERQDLQQLSREGVTVSAQDLPGSRRIDLPQLLKRDE